MTTGALHRRASFPAGVSIKGLLLTSKDLLTAF